MFFRLKILIYSGESVLQLSRSTFGAVAQLIERVVRNDEVVGLIPICSTNFFSHRKEICPPTRWRRRTSALAGKGVAGSRAACSPPNFYETKAAPSV